MHISVKKGDKEIIKKFNFKIYTKYKFLIKREGIKNVMPKSID